MTDIHHHSAFERLIERIYDDIDEYGYSVFGVPGGADRPPWAHTIGLVDEFGHPELGIIGEPFVRAEALLDKIVFEISGGIPVPLDRDIVVDGIVYHVQPIEPAILDGEPFAAWRAYYDYLRSPPHPQLSALEIIRCGAQPTNRAQRRASGRHLRLAR